jgi:hypothetical protein
MTTKLTTKLTFFLFIIIATISCNDKGIQPTKPKKEFIETINVQNDQNLLTLIGELYNKKTNPSGRSLSTSFGELSLDKALKLNDTTYDRTRYTLVLGSTTGLSFENLIISVREEGVFHYILQYKPDPSWLASNRTTIDWSEYSGQVNQLDMDRKIISQVNLFKGVNNNSKGKGGRTQEDCCTWESKVSTATGLPYLEIDCGPGGSYLLFYRTSGCGGGDGGGSSGGIGGGGSGGSGGSGGGGTGGSGGSGSAGGSGGGVGSSPIAIMPPNYDDIPLPLIKNRISNPCIKALADQLISSNLENVISLQINNYFNNTDKINLFFRDATSEDILDVAGTKIISNTNSSFNIEIALRTEKLSTYSKEYIAKTIVHEAVHAYLLAIGYTNSQLSQHRTMVKFFIDWMQQALLEQFPNMPPGDALGIVLIGFADLFSSPDDSLIYDEMIVEYGFVRGDIFELANQYKQINKNNAKGTLCD